MSTTNSTSLSGGQMQRIALRVVVCFDFVRLISLTQVSHIYAIAYIWTKCGSATFRRAIRQFRSRGWTRYISFFLFLLGTWLTAVCNNRFVRTTTSIAGQQDHGLLFSQVRKLNEARWSNLVSAFMFSTHYLWCLCFGLSRYMDDSAIIEEGTHADLIRKDCEYARIWKLQAEAFLSWLWTITY